MRRISFEKVALHISIKYERDALIFLQPFWNPLRQYPREGTPSEITNEEGSYDDQHHRFVPFRSPLDTLGFLQQRLNSIFSDFAGPTGELQNESLSAGNFIPPVDIYEDAHRLVLKLEVPGIAQEDLEINLENQTLTIKGERKFVQDEKEEDFLRIERRYGAFVRNFTLPPTVETDSAQATEC